MPALHASAPLPSHAAGASGLAAALGQRQWDVALNRTPEGAGDEAIGVGGCGGRSRGKYFGTSTFRLARRQGVDELRVELRAPSKRPVVALQRQLRPGPTQAVRGEGEGPATTAPRCHSSRAQIAHRRAIDAEHDEPRPARKRAPAPQIDAPTSLTQAEGAPRETPGRVR